MADSSEIYGNDSVRLTSHIRVIILLNVVLGTLGFISYSAGKISGGSPDMFFSLTALPADLHHIIMRPWTILTHIFYHTHLSHFLSNMGILILILLPLSGRKGSERVAEAYLCGGIGGVISFLIFSNFMAPQLISSHLTGASAAVLGVAGFIILSHYNVTLKVTNKLRIPYIVIPIILASVAFVFSTAPEAGASAAHIGGFAAGIIFGIICHNNAIVIHHDARSSITH